MSFLSNYVFKFPGTVSIVLRREKQEKMASHLYNQQIYFEFIDTIVYMSFFILNNKNYSDFKWGSFRLDWVFFGVLHVLKNIHDIVFRIRNNHS